MSCRDRHAAEAYAFTLAGLMAELLNGARPIEPRLNQAAVLSHEVCSYLQGRGAQEILGDPMRANGLDGTEQHTASSVQRLAQQREQIRGRTLQNLLARAREVPEGDLLGRKRLYARVLLSALCLASDIPSPPPRPVDIGEALLIGRRIYNDLDLAHQGRRDRSLVLNETRRRSQRLMEMLMEPAS